MIQGVGNDIVDIQRIEQALVRHGHHFMARVLSATECAQAQGYAHQRLKEFVAGRFAAKEALAKALGCGLAQLSMPNVTIQLGEQGLSVAGDSHSFISRLPPGDRLHITISHTPTTAYAVAIWERPPQG